MIQEKSLADAVEARQDTSTVSPVQNPGLDEIPGDLVREMGDTELKVATGITLADAMRASVDAIPQVVGWGDGVSGACALTTVRKTLIDQGYV